MNSKEEGISFIMPVFNEEEIIFKELNNFIQFARELPYNFSIIVVENGSTDQTPFILKDLEQKFESLEVLTLDKANSGRALKKGLSKSPHERNFILHADHWDTKFIISALKLLENYPLVQASKNLPESDDQRPKLRKLLTRAYNWLLRIFFGFNGTDTTGLKALKKSTIQPVLERCKLEREMLESELVLRCQSLSVPVKELPVTLEEKRPQRDPLIKKIFMNAVDLLRLIYIFYTEKDLNQRRVESPSSSEQFPGENPDVEQLN